MLYKSKVSLLSLLFLLTGLASIGQEDNDSNDDAVPFAVAEKTPAYPGCEELSGKELKKCTVEKIINHVNSNFNTALGKQSGITGKTRIIVQFKINDQGKITNVRARSLADDPKAREILQNEATHVVNSLPQMQPGQYKGENVGIMYSLPIVFAVPEKEDKKG